MSKIGKVYANECATNVIDIVSTVTGYNVVAQIVNENDELTETDRTKAEEIVRRINAFEDGGIVEELKVACEVGLDAIKALLKVDIKFNTKNNKSLKEIIEFVKVALEKS